MKAWEHPSAALAFAGWASTFILSWLILLHRVELSAMSIVFLIFFAFVALIATSIASVRRSE